MSNVVEPRQPHVGNVVVYTDSQGEDLNALVTCVFGEVGADHDGTIISAPCVNVVFINKDPRCDDPYGRQTERDTSVVHKMDQQAHGNCWRWPDEEKPVYHPPTEK